MQAAAQMLSERVFVLKSIRVLYEKTGLLRFTSHLDMTRFMSRVLRRAELPLWVTEGFNPHIYITFALPLSLGHESLYEIMEFRLTREDLCVSEILERLNAQAPCGIRFLECFEPEAKLGEVAFADYEVCFDDGGALLAPLEEFLKSDSILVEKKTKRGGMKTLELREKIKRFELSCDGATVLKITLPASPCDNINPELLLTAFFENEAQEYYNYRVLRRLILDGSLRPFR